MRLDEALVRRVAALARLRLSDDEVVQAQGQLSAVLEAVAGLSTVDTEGVAPTLAVNDEPSPLRDDVVRAELTSEQALANAPDRIGTGFAVPKVIE
jgi:aspartyl-tRNA(Asn)/glutamyl-tRNA(Gln) amidotransferase subunit C